jgi:hypothetical protein
LEDAAEFWDEERLGRLPDAYHQLYAAWDENGLWGSVEARWELERFEIGLPGSASSGDDRTADTTERH